EPGSTPGASITADGWPALARPGEKPMDNLRRYLLILAAAASLTPALGAPPTPAAVHRFATILRLSVIHRSGGARLFVHCSTPVRARVAQKRTTVTLNIPASRLGRVPHLPQPGHAGLT